MCSFYKWMVWLLGIAFDMLIFNTVVPTFRIIGFLAIAGIKERLSKVVIR